MNNPKFSSQFIQVVFSVFIIVSIVGISFSKTYASSITHQAIVQTTNADRAASNVSVLVESQELNEAALSKAQDMFQDNYFDHYSPNGLTPWDFILGSGYDYQLAGENLAMDFATAEGVNNAWLNSPAHARNILNPDFTNIGVAVLNGELEGHQTTLVVQMFGSKQASFFHNMQIPLVNTVTSLLGLNY